MRGCKSKFGKNTNKAGTINWLTFVFFTVCGIERAKKFNKKEKSKRRREKNVEWMRLVETRKKIKTTNKQMESKEKNSEK